MPWWMSVTRSMNRLGVPYPLLNFIVTCSKNILSEIKFEVTDRCNLACSFCHQDFGVKDGTDALDRDVFEKLLAVAKGERIPIVRITGGEPLLLKTTDDLIRRAKELGFRIILNTNGTALTEKRLQALAGMVDCFKISLPAASEQAMTRLTGSDSTWRRKWDAIERLQQHAINADVMTVMTSENIRQFDTFVRLLEPYDKICWKPLRAEPQEGGGHPVARQDIRDLAAKIRDARGNARWSNLKLFLATPYCALENPHDAIGMFAGGITCGPLDSLTVTSKGEAISCYSRRESIDIGKGFRAAAREQVIADFDALPGVCRSCPLGPMCRGGCRCQWALEQTDYGMIDYLADPARMPHARQIAGNHQLPAARSA
jgi:radical SAM protein with 4Fe4S-binding SPASM domain